MKTYVFSSLEYYFIGLNVIMSSLIFKEIQKKVKEDIITFIGLNVIMSSLTFFCISLKIKN